MSITIPTAEIHEGLKKCKEKTENYFAIAKTCMNENKNDEGYVNAISGLEEFGRASMFFESLKNAIDANSDVVTIEKRKIYNHIEKQKTALSILPPALRNLAMGTLNPQNYTDDFVADRGGQITVLQDLRERAQFVDLFLYTTTPIRDNSSRKLPIVCLSFILFSVYSSPVTLSALKSLSN